MTSKSGANHDLLVRAFDGAPVAMAVVSAEPPYRVIAANAAFAAEAVAADGGSGSDPARLVGASLLDLVPAAANGDFDTILANARNGAAPRIVTCHRFGRGLRYSDVALTTVNDGPDKALLYVSRDISDTERSRRSLEIANRRLAAIGAVSREITQAEPGPLIQAAAVAAATICEGPALVLLVHEGSALTRAASHAVPPRLVPDRIEITRLPCVARALHLASTQTASHSDARAPDERALLNAATASWLVATPIRGRTGAVGAIVTVWRRTSGPTTDDVASLELIAGQVGITVQHDHFLGVAEASRARLALVLEGMPDSVWIVGADGTLERTNRVGAQLLGISGGNPRLPTIAELSARFETTDDTYARDPLGLRRALAGETVQHVDAMLSERRQEVWVNSAAAPLRSPSGAIVGAVGISHDVTEQRRTDAAIRLLAHASTELSATLDYHRSLVSVARAIVAMKLADWCIMDLFEPDGSVLRLPLAHRSADDVAVARNLRHAVPAANGTLLADVLAGDAPRTYYRLRPSAHALLSRDPAEAEMLATLQPSSLMIVPIISRGRRLGVMQLLRTTTPRPFTHNDAAVAEDLAQRAAMAIDNAQLFDEARAADHRKDEFLGVLSHELRTPLTSVMVWAGILRSDTDPARIRRAAEVIERNVRIQTGLINDLLDLTSISRGKMKLECKPEDLREVLDVAVDIVREAAAQRSIAITYDRPSTSLPVHADAKRLQQVFWNILNNAIKFTPARGSVTVRVADTPQGPVVRVKDSGEGIAREFLPFVFDMFRQQRREGGRPRGGLGIGLALAKQLVDVHGGRIEAHSDGKGTGSEFTVRLPRLDETGAWRDTPDAPHEAAAPLRGISVLIVEDVHDIAAGAKALLEKHGARVLDARNGQEALRQLANGGCDVVLSDLWMPVMDGFTLAREIRADPARARMPVIAVSGLASSADFDRARECGFNAFLRKPFDDEALLGIVRQMLIGDTAMPAAPDLNGTVSPNASSSEPMKSAPRAPMGESHDH